MSRSEFQSLICWKSDSDRYWHNRFFHWSEVSILDLLEVGFRRLFLVRNKNNSHGFNPWFVGSRIQTFVDFGCHPIPTGVSILDLLEVGFRLVNDLTPWLVSERFQSLICWKSDSDADRPARRLPCRPVSILDLLEVGFRLGILIFTNVRRPARFQSLICWKSDSDRWLTSAECVWRRGFNPWFVGSRIQTCIRLCWFPSGSWFQSLICWKSDSDRKRRNRLPNPNPRFNPWFVGSRIQTRYFFISSFMPPPSFNPWFVGSRIQTWRMSIIP